jgi:hypothetical protein
MNNLIKYENTKQENKKDVYPNFTRIIQYFDNIQPFNMNFENYTYKVLLTENHQSFDNKSGVLEHNQFLYNCECISTVSKHLNFNILMNVNEDFGIKFLEKATMAKTAYYDAIKASVEKDKKEKEEKEAKKKAIEENEIKKENEELKSFINNSQEKRQKTKLMESFEARTREMIRSLPYAKINMDKISNNRAISVEGNVIFEYLEMGGDIYGYVNFEDLFSPQQVEVSRRMKAINNSSM